MNKLDWDYLSMYQSHFLVRGSEKISLLLSLSNIFYLDGYFSYRIYDAKLESILTKQLLKVSAIDFLFVIVIPFNVK